MGEPKRHTIDDLVATEVGPIESLTPHPRNYRVHPPEEIEHLQASLEQFGQTKNVVVARDGTILAGHGVVDAAWSLGWTTIEFRRLDLDPDSPEALKLLALDNTLPVFALDDDRALTELLRDVHQDALAGLLGTGFDEMTLAALAMVSRTSDELPDVDAAREWVGMPEYEPGTSHVRLIVMFDTPESRTEFMERLNLPNEITVTKHWPRSGVISARYPKLDEAINSRDVRWEPDDE
jgi:hypothetical protein